MVPVGNSKITIEFDSEKYKALLKFSAKKNINIEGELCDTLEKLYQKNVPAVVREFIEDV